METRTRTLRRGVQIARWTWSSGWKIRDMNRGQSDPERRDLPARRNLDVYPSRVRGRSGWSSLAMSWNLALLRSRNQISRESVEEVVLPPGGELSLIKKEVAQAAAPAQRATLLDYLPPQSLLLLCAPDVLAERAAAYEEQVPTDDPFFEEWRAFWTVPPSARSRRYPLGRARTGVYHAAERCRNIEIPLAVRN